jgi:hypothetical protein
MLLHVDVNDDIGVEEGSDDIHMFYRKVMIACKCKKNAKSGVPDCGGKDGGVIKILHVATGNEATLVLENRSRTITFNLVFP